MIELPKRCEVNKFIPKKIFYEKVGVSSAVQSEFVNQIERITWLYKISSDTIGISKTESVEEIEVFQLDLKNRVIPKNVINSITKGIPYKILFILKHDRDFCYLLKLDDIYNTEWNKEVKFEFNAINLDILYENIVKQIIDKKEDNRKVEEIIKEKNIISGLEKKVNDLIKKIKKEKQFNRKVELNKELNETIKKMEEINNE